jgi:N-formylglutamate amidohydrolase
MGANIELSFDQYGPRQPQSPAIVSVPHSGRAYPTDLARLTHFGSDCLIPLEDRHADLLTQHVASQGHRLMIARTPRAVIDLNRDETDFDPAMLHPLRRSARQLSAKARSGLGLVPRRIAKLGEIWHSKLSEDELSERVASVHRPYHAALAAAMDAAHSRFGATILIDLHSMPPLPKSIYGQPPQIVIGDRFGRSCHGRFAARAAGLAEAYGIKTAFNVPYAGGHILDRHGRPDSGRHAIQIEIDRSLYLAENLRDPGPGLARMQAFVATLANTLAEEIAIPITAIAAE